MLIAVPSNTPGGLEATISGHFGHCDVFTLIRIEDGDIVDVTLLPNGGHEQGGCLTPVMLLKDQGVEGLVAGGMGPRPLQGFQSVGIQVWFKEHARTVQEAARMVIDGAAREFGDQHSCGGHGDDHECGGHDHAHAERPAIDGPATVGDHRVVTINFEMHDTEGNLIDASPEGNPLRYLHGHGSLPPGLEAALVGLEAGATLHVEVPADQAFGPRDEARLIPVDASLLPPGTGAGDTVHMRSPDGVTMPVRIVSVEGEVATLDGNHPLAEEDLVFDVTVVQVEAATEQELAQDRVLS